MSPASYQTAPPRDVFLWRAGNGTRTRDPNLGKVVLYQLSYSRVDFRSVLREPIVVPGFRFGNSESNRGATKKVEARGIEPLTS